jgi:tetraacyldisaccharide 4'-kinase
LLARSSIEVSGPLPRWCASLPVTALASLLYGAVVQARNRWYDRNPERSVKVSCPVISIGGIRAGGSGKTPVVMLLVDLLLQRGRTVAVLSRGYKRHGTAPLLLAPDEQASWRLLGDEPAMIRRAYPQTWLGIGADRCSNAAKLEKRMGSGAVVLLDDGFQHRRLRRDCDIVCIHEELFSDHLLPRGYLREPLSGLHRASLLFLVGTRERIDALYSVGKKLTKLFPELPQFLLLQEFAGWVNVTDGTITQTLPFEHPAAFCGIARPHRFFSMLAAKGITPCRKVVFGDHHNYTERDFSLLRKLYSYGLVTTEKDAVRLKELPNLPENRLWYGKMRLTFVENRSLHRFNEYITEVIPPE